MVAKGRGKWCHPRVWPGAPTAPDSLRCGQAHLIPPISPPAPQPSPPPPSHPPTPPLQARLLFCIGPGHPRSRGAGAAADPLRMGPHANVVEREVGHLRPGARLRSAQPPRQTSRCSTGGGQNLCRQHGRGACRQLRETAGGKPARFPAQGSPARRLGGGPPGGTREGVPRGGMGDGCRRLFKRRPHQQPAAPPK